MNFTGILIMKVLKSGKLRFTPSKLLFIIFYPILEVPLLVNLL